MRTFEITYQRSNGTIDTEIVNCKTAKLNKSINDYYFNINAEILKVEQL
jgi:hypothetical protein